jgi:hypothetical protein
MLLLIQRGEKFGLTLEPGDALGFRHERFGENLDRDVAFQFSFQQIEERKAESGTYNRALPCA